VKTVLNIPAACGCGTLQARGYIFVVWTDIQSP